MRIVIQTDGCFYEREIERLTYLFFEGAVITIRDAVDGTPVDGTADMTVDLRLTPVEGRLRAAGTLTMGSQVHQSSYAVEVPEAASNVSVRRLGKRAVLHVLHELLTAVAGEGQPWGILTGVRPTKLVHEMMRRQVPEAEIRRCLREDYLLSADRVELLLEIAAAQQRVIPQLYALDGEVSVYVGIPFCPTHCAYCTFPAYSMQDKATYVEGFLEAMAAEFAQLGQLLREYELSITSVYIGGGTPTSLRGPELERLFDMMYTHLPNPEQWRELDVEAGRPDTITPDRVRVMKKYGVTRVSVNPQTYKASTLRDIGRGHTPDIVDHRFQFVRDAGFDNINMDLIVGLPGETVDDVRYTLERIGRLQPESVTVHTMSFKTSAVVKEERERFRIPTAATVREMMREAKAWARDLGYGPYYLYRQKDILGNQENIGFALPGKESVYNICIMEERQAILGVGGGAVSKLIGSGGKHFGRFANPREPRAYIEGLVDLLRRKEVRLREVFETHRNAGGEAGNRGSACGSEEQEAIVQ
ncbi:coproporphyrinogen III oxidase [Alicyclobacillus contaminans]|uniref:coproporphyrinogen dehydrogenase HemZ n=1 Tax=Alicyclobacillus contaminans TaxID=392016 RepID=UPI000406D0AC|nr:coproporphyrinogen dehydrogenase HemZ [Alicyclobacillus contaminans]GMA48857.1 coproporphyrinogen III oxidase [Alicyclobacillus contaminans]